MFSRKAPDDRTEPGPASGGGFADRPGARLRSRRYRAPGRSPPWRRPDRISPHCDRRVDGCARSPAGPTPPAGPSTHGRRGFARVVRLTARVPSSARGGSTPTGWPPLRSPGGLGRSGCHRPRTASGPVAPRVYARVRKPAAWAPMNILGAWVCPRTSTGMIEASATRRPRTPRTRSCGSTTLFSSEPIRQVPAGW